jgi:hypothetical protein
MAKASSYVAARSNEYVPRAGAFILASTSGSTMLFSSSFVDPSA